MLNLRRSVRLLSNHATRLADEVRRATSAIVARERETVMRLMRAAEFRDPETGAHIQHMAHYSRLIGSEMGLSPGDQELLLTAAPMHDIGKLGIPDRILYKPGRLDTEEMAVMRQHAQFGYDILRDSRSNLLHIGAEIAFTHHEKYDGSGYPRGLRGEEIPLLGRIVAVADVFDAILSPRPYKQAWSLDRAVAFMRENRGKHFDPDCVDALFARWDEVLGIRDNRCSLPSRFDAAGEPVLDNSSCE